METTYSFNQEDVLHRLAHFLPAQNPLKDFIHHNTLHAFQDLKFHEALHKSSKVFGYKTYLSLSDFRNKYQKKEINHHILVNIIEKKVGTKNTSVWLDKVLQVSYNESLEKRVGKLRQRWNSETKFNLDKATHGILFRTLCSYLDQGIAIWPFPVHSKGFLASIKSLNKNGYNILFQSNRASLLLEQNATLFDLLKIVVGDERYFENYIFDQQFSHPGWSGMVNSIAHHPDSLLDRRKITLEELLIFELLLEIDALDKKFGTHWKPLAEMVKQAPEDYFKEVAPSEYFEVLAIWQEAFEWSFYNQVLYGLQKQPKKETQDNETSFQALFCMDDRECSFRRYIEGIDDKAKTFGVAAFFNFEFYYQPLHGKFFTKLCPAPVSPKYLIKELPRKKKQAKDYHYHKRTHSLFFGWIISQTLGFSAAWKLFLNIFKPTLTPATSASFKHLDKKSQLLIENTDSSLIEDGLQLGFTIEEMADRVEGILKTIGLVTNFSSIVYVIGHGATSVNNTHFAGYDCGACSGRPSSVNAKVLCFAANHTQVREILAKKGILIPKTTKFIPGLHDTTRDEIAFYDEEKLEPTHHLYHEKNKQIFEKALLKNAKERSRRFDLIDNQNSLENIHKKVKERSVSLFEPRPELNHATNALCIVGRRTVSDHLFLDRRSFMNSYDYTIDPNGNYLAGILNAVAPVGGGINLEYYFSRVDNHKLGAGSKLPHNVMGLIGVANGIDGDLRPGLPSQMIEMHDPIRLLIIVEHYKEIVFEAISRNSATYEWFFNEWVNLIVLEPKTQILYRFVAGTFESYQPVEENLPIITDVLKYTEKSSENLPIAILNS